MHVHSGGEFGEVAEKRGSEIDGVGIVGAEGGMFLAERGGVWSYGEAALVTVGEAKGTAGGIFVERLGFLCAGLSGCELSGLGVRQNSAISALARALLSRVWEGCVANKRVSAHPSLRLGARKSAICALAERRGETKKGLRRKQGSREARKQRGKEAGRDRVGKRELAGGGG